MALQESLERDRDSLYCDKDAMVTTLALPDPKSLCHFCITSRDFVLLNCKSSLKLFLLIKNASYGPLKCNPDYSGKLERHLSV